MPNLLFPLRVLLSLVLAAKGGRHASAVPAAKDGAGHARPVIRAIESSRSLSCVGGPRTADDGLAAGVFFGDDVDSPERMREALARYERRHGAPPSLVKIFHSLDADFSATGPAGRLLRTLLRWQGVTPLISLEPTWAGSPPRGLLDFIASGGADERLIEIARGFADAAPGPILVELGAEMNARFDAPWQAERNGVEQGPAAFVRAWRHVVRLMNDQGAGDVRWVLAPSAGNPYTHHPTGPEHWDWYGHWYPGRDYVDYMGLHAFNHARAQGAWVPFIELVTGDAADHMLDDMIVRFPEHRIIVGELATSEHPEQQDAKGRWIDDAYRRLRGCRSVAGVIWFDMDKETDWHIDSSADSAAAYRAAVRQGTVHERGPEPAVEPPAAGSEKP